MYKFITAFFICAVIVFPSVFAETLKPSKYITAHYLAEWIRHVEYTGNQNLPQTVKNHKTEGSLIMEIQVKYDGSLRAVKLLKSSGNNELDLAARRMVFRAAPFAAFPPKLRAAADHLEIVRTWVYDKDGLSSF